MSPILNSSSGGGRWSDAASLPIRSGMTYRSSQSPWLTRSPTAELLSAGSEAWGRWARILPAAAPGRVDLGDPALEEARVPQERQGRFKAPAFQGGDGDLSAPGAGDDSDDLGHPDPGTRGRDPGGRSVPFPRRRSTPSPAGPGRGPFSRGRPWPRARVFPERSGTDTVSPFRMIWEKTTALRKKKLAKIKAYIGMSIRRFLDMRRFQGVRIPEYLYHRIITK